MSYSVTRFTAEQAFEDSESGDPIMIDSVFAQTICEDHGANFNDYPINDSTFKDVKIDAADLLAWLGY